MGVFDTEPLLQAPLRCVHPVVPPHPPTHRRTTVNVRALALLLALTVVTAHAAPPFVIWDTVRTQFTRDSAGLINLCTDPTTAPLSHSYVSPLPADTANAIAIWAAIQPTCPCCAMAAFTWPRAFYQSRQPMTAFNFGETLDLSDTTKFALVGRPGSYTLNLGSSAPGWQYAVDFSRFMALPVIHPFSHDTTYALAAVDSIYLDSTATHYREGGVMSYPRVSCANTASVRIFRAVDGSLDFRDLADLGVNRPVHSRMTRRVVSSTRTGPSTYTITGRRVPPGTAPSGRECEGSTRVLVTR